MARPSLTPMTFSEFDRPKGDRSPGWLIRSIFRLIRLCFRGSFRGFMRLWTTDLASAGLRKTLPIRAVVMGVVMKLAWLPPAILLACGWAVYRQTHPPGPLTGGSATQPSVARITNAFSERVSFRSSDGMTLSAIWVPAIKPQDVIGQGDELLKRREAAVVLVHDHGQDAGQMLAQAALLHELGLHVLVLETRGSGMSEWSARTYGRLERHDVAAAVDYLASRPTVDTARIAVWAVGTGADAAEQAPSNTHIALLLSERGPVYQEGVDYRFLPPHRVYDPLRPVCRWLFDVGVAGGALPANTPKPGRIVELGAGEVKLAIKELSAFASESLMAQTR